MCERQAAPTPELAELREAMEDCRTRIRGTGLGAQEWLDLRWEELNATRRPLWMLRDMRVDHPDHPHDEGLIPVPLIVQGGGEALWGDVDNRGDSYRQIVQGLLDSSTDEWLHRMGTVSLERHDGPLGPAYAVCSDGRHRVHTAKALDLPHLNARIDQVWPTPEVGDLLVGSQRRHMSLLGDLGFLENVDALDPWPAGTLTTPLEVPWGLEPPKSVARISRDYATIYPEFREHPFYQLTATPEAAGTLEYLTLHAPAPPPPDTPPQPHRAGGATSARSSPSRSPRAPRGERPEDTHLSVRALVEQVADQQAHVRSLCPHRVLQASLNLSEASVFGGVPGSFQKIDDGACSFSGTTTAVSVVHSRVHVVRGDHGHDPVVPLEEQRDIATGDAGRHESIVRLHRPR